MGRSCFPLQAEQQQPRCGNQSVEHVHKDAVYYLEQAQMLFNEELVNVMLPSKMPDSYENGAETPLKRSFESILRLRKQRKILEYNF